MTRVWGGGFISANNVVASVTQTSTCDIIRIGAKQPWIVRFNKALANAKRIPDFNKVIFDFTVRCGDVSTQKYRVEAQMTMGGFSMTLYKWAYGAESWLPFSIPFGAQGLDELEEIARRDLPQIL
jgi:hypothetical protein